MYFHINVFFFFLQRDFISVNLEEKKTFFSHCSECHRQVVQVTMKPSLFFTYPLKQVFAFATLVLSYLLPAECVRKTKQNLCILMWIKATSDLDF